MSEGVTRELPRYRSHKEVWALKIKDITPGRAGEEGLSTDCATLSFVDNGYAPLVVSLEWMLKHEPQVGGYYVVYQDGYTSYSPAQAFEEGYTRI